MSDYLCHKFHFDDGQVRFISTHPKLRKGHEFGPIFWHSGSLPDEFEMADVCKLYEHCLENFAEDKAAHYFYTYIDNISAILSRTQRPKMRKVINKFLAKPID